jgi:ABC-type nitrate/sulfonate/bicarbonate transport system substrate-binding protein
VIRARFLVLPIVAVVTLAACGSSKSSSATTAAGGDDTVTRTAISTARCDLNKKAGTITYLTGFSYTASVSQGDVMVAKANGYFDKMCLDVKIQAGNSIDNFKSIGAGQAQFCSAGSLTELATANTSGTNLRAVIDFGKTTINELVVKPEVKATKPGDLKGKTLGIKFAMPPAITAMLSAAGLGKDAYKQLDVSSLGFDPTVHWQQPIDALAVYKSNEPAQLKAKNIAFDVLDPSTTNTPGSFGVIYTSAGFINDHPTAAQDFVRAVLKGFDEGAKDAAKTAEITTGIWNKADPNGAFPAASEAAKWAIEVKLVQDFTPKGEAIGLVDAAVFQAEIDAYAKAGVFETKPDISQDYNADIAKGVYDAQGLIWPA